MAETVPPELTPAERAAALEKGMESRRRRAEAKAKVRSGELSIGEVIAMRDDWAIGRMKVRDLIRSLPSYGGLRADHVMAEVGIAPSRRVRGLGKNQAAKLIERLGE